MGNRGPRPCRMPDSSSATRGRSSRHEVYREGPSGGEPSLTRAGLEVPRLPTGGGGE